MFIFSFCFCVNSTKTVNPLTRLIHNIRRMVEGLKSMYMQEIAIQIFLDLPIVTFIHSFKLFYLAAKNLSFSLFKVAPTGHFMAEPG